MLLFVLAYLGGALTIVSPCILPVLPFVFARADRPFVQSGLPMLIGMAVTFALVATLAAVAGGWAVEANQYGRLAAMALLALFGVALLFPSLATRMMEPVVALGGRLSQASQASSEQGSVLSSLLLGAATGLLWAPCAGPMLGLILTGAALQGANVHTTLLLLAYALGAATSLALALAVGGKVFAAMKRSFWSRGIDPARSRRRRLGRCGRHRPRLGYRCPDQAVSGKHRVAGAAAARSAASQVRWRHRFVGRDDRGRPCHDEWWSGHEVRRANPDDDRSRYDVRVAGHDGQRQVGAQGGARRRGTCA
jgi:cytochrome c biogenesis protein CcdA